MSLRALGRNAWQSNSVSVHTRLPRAFHALAITNMGQHFRCCKFLPVLSLRLRPQVCTAPAKTKHPSCYVIARSAATWQSYSNKLHAAKRLPRPVSQVCDSPRAGLRPVARVHTPAGAVVMTALKPQPLTHRNRQEKAAPKTFINCCNYGKNMLYSNWQYVGCL